MTEACMLLKTASLVLAFGIVFAGAAYPKDKYHGGAVDAREHGYEHGYRDGVTAGADDFSHHRGGRPDDLRDFREADHGYRPAYGDKLIYQRQYRDSFEQGYRDGLRGIR